MKKLVFILASVSLLLEGCDKTPATGQLHGQVFIVTEGGESIKLALTNIMLYKPSDIETAKAAYSKADEPRQADLQKRKKDLNAEYESLMQEPNKIQQTYAGRENSLEAESAVSGLKLKIAAIKLETARFERDYYRRDDSLFFQQLPAPVATATTDADGKFDLSLSKNGRFALAAMNTRSVGENTEKYFWLVWVSLEGQQSKTLMLSNRNLMEASDPDNILQQEKPN